VQELGWTYENQKTIFANTNTEFDSVAVAA